jgi:MFS family permease
MSSTRWQIEPPPLAPGAGAQWLIAALVALGPFSLTMYQPALPAIARSLNISTAQVQLTLTVYLASFAIGQLIYGPMSDHFGRRRTLLVGLAIFVVGAIACALASSAGVLIAARVLQGLGACAGPALGRAMIRDLYGAKGSAKAMAFVASALSIAPAIAPVFGAISPEQPGGLGSSVRSRSLARRCSSSCSFGYPKRTRMSRVALFASYRCWGATSSLVRAVDISATCPSPQ